MNTTNLDSAITYIKSKVDFIPKVALILGSGLGAVADGLENPIEIPTTDIPGWPTSSVQGHEGKLLFGHINQQPVVFQQGRVHFYEGHSIQAVTYPIRVLIKLGIEYLIITNAAGGINPNFSPGDIMVINDHINMPGLSGQNPLIGPNDDSIGPRFPDMTRAYNPELRKMAHDIGKKLDISLQEGVYTFVAGPSYETPSELRFLINIGADAVGMSTVPSVIVANHAGIKVLGFSSITNSATPDPAPDHEVNHEEVLEVGKIIVPNMVALIEGILEEL